MANFCTHLSKLKTDVYFTLLTTDAFFDRITKEIARSYDLGEEQCAERIR